MFKFITSRPLWVNIIAAIVLALSLLFLFLQMLSWITQHGEFLKVPRVLGMKTDEAIKLLKKQGFDVQIQDSVYNDTTSKGIVLKQLPDANATVKVNRTVFLTVNKVVPPMVDMPKLEDQSLNFALDMLFRNHLTLGDTIYRPHFMQGAVIEQQFNGVRIPEKTKIPWGSKITLIVGEGLGDKQILVPELVNMTFAEGRALLQEEGIVWSVMAEGVKDTANAYIIKQSPERFDEDKRPRYIQAGQVMDLWLSPVMNSNSDSLQINLKN